MYYELKDAAFVQTFGGESWIDDRKTDDYGFQLGDLTVHNLTGVEFAKFVCSAMNHLMQNGHRFELVIGETGTLEMSLKKGE